MIDSQLYILQQAEDHLSVLSDEQYTEVIAPYFISSAGAHIRHILDHYLAIMDGLTCAKVDYDKRRRGGQVEHSREAALNTIQQIKSFLESLTEAQLKSPITLSTQVAVQETLVVLVPTTVLREVIFAGSHAVHHFAMIKQIALHQGVSLDNSLGIAPATASFLREQQ